MFLFSHTYCLAFPCSPLAVNSPVLFSPSENTLGIANENAPIARSAGHSLRRWAASVAAGFIMIKHFLPQVSAACVHLSAGGLHASVFLPRAHTLGDLVLIVPVPQASDLLSVLLFSSSQC